MALDKLGETPDGNAWCLKALHPSDPLTEVKGIPDETCPPSTFLNYQTVTTMGSTNGATGTWHAECQLFPHPINFLSAVLTDSNGASPVQHLNSQVTGATMPAKMSNFLSYYVAWRLAYAGVTIIQDGPALSDQGVIVVCQKQVQPCVYNVSCNDSAGYTHGYSHVIAFTPESQPTFACSQAMPNSFMIASKEGAYIPLKLTKTHQQWQTSRDNVYFGPLATWAGDGETLQPKVASNGIWPFFDVNMLAVDASTANALVSGSLISGLCSDISADICIQNVSVNTRFNFYYRYGFEVQVLPNSTLSPYLSLSPRVDVSAIQNYFRIARELKDAYPASYNDFGTMLSEIMSAVGDIAVGLAPVNPIIGAIGGGIGAIGKMWKASNSQKNANKALAAAAPEQNKFLKATTSAAVLDEVKTQLSANLRKKKVTQNQNKNKKKQKGNRAPKRPIKMTAAQLKSLGY